METMFGFKPRTGSRRIEIRQDDPAKCGCNDQFRVVELDGSGREVRVFGSEIKGYAVAQNIAELAAEGRI